MNGRRLLDTNVVIALFADDSALAVKINETEDISVPAVVIGELFYGANKSGRPEENTKRINEFASDNMVLNCDTDTAKWYGKIKNRLREKGRTIPENDIWVAAIALQHDLILVSRDKHFEKVEELKLERW